MRARRNESHARELISDLEEFLRDYGILPAATRLSIDATVQDWLEQRKIQARVRSVRHGTLTLAADPQQLALLRYDVDTLLDHISERHPFVIAGVQLKAERADPLHSEPVEK